VREKRGQGTEERNNQALRVATRKVRERIGGEGKKCARGVKE
jgi:hypothetical protein